VFVKESYNYIKGIWGGTLAEDNINQK